MAGCSLVTELLLCSLLICIICLASGERQLADSGVANHTGVVDRIIEHIFRGYNKHQRPSAHCDSADRDAGNFGAELLNEPPTEVFVNLKILSINKVDVINMEFTLDMYLRQYWKDHRLMWKHNQFRFYNESIAIPAKKENLWLPDLFFRNGKEGYLHKMTQPNYLIRVDPDGSILYSQKVTMKFSCQMQLQTFPMDTPVPSPDSDIDTYSRFVFPACFLLYNCFYWLYYLVLVGSINPRE